jgi:hypothetical protein
MAGLSINKSRAEWETSSVSDTFSNLCSMYNGKRVPLSVINSKLQVVHEDMGISMATIKKVGAWLLLLNSWHCTTSRQAVAAALACSCCQCGVVTRSRPCS